jgi:peptidoglycan/LPS O-acetylase OafA/YrhL
MRYSPALDGLRAIAVLIVLTHHSWLLPGGWIGVDVFFVLSGYLITSILDEELCRTGIIRFGNFYLRRALRLTPALLLLCLFQFVRAPFSDHAAEIRQATIISGLYLQDLKDIFPMGDSGLMGHTWSLAIEEQFYWLWPVALLLIAHRRPAAWLAGALAVMLIARLVLAREGASDGVLQYTFIRPCGLFIGCLLGLARDRLTFDPPRFAVPALLTATLALAAICGEKRGIVLGPLLASLLTVGTIACLHGGGRAVSALSWAPLRYVGKISYGLYLYSMPIFIIAKSHFPHMPTVVMVPVIFLAAALSYEFVEKPCLRLKGRFAGEHTTLLARGGGAVGADGRIEILQGAPVQ